MKRALKITGISLGCLLGLVIIAVVVAYSTITSPKRLTQLVQKHVPKFIDFDLELQQARLTLKTFPDIGLEIDGVTIMSPMEGAPSDTLAHVAKLTVGADAKRYLNGKDIVVKQCILDDVYVNLFTNAEGKSNLDIFSSESSDTTSSTFESLLDLQEVKINNAKVLYNDQRSKLSADARGLDLDVKGTLDLKEKNVNATLGLGAKQLRVNTEAVKGDLRQLDLGFDGKIEGFNKIDGKLDLGSTDATLFAGYEVLTHDKISLRLPVAMMIDPLGGHINDATIGLNDYIIALGGAFQTKDEGIETDLAFSTNTLDIEEVMGKLPENVRKSLADMGIKGKATLTDGKVKGIVSDSLMPVITAQVNATDAQLRIAQLPYPFTNANLSSKIHVDLNDSINVNDIQLSALLNRSKIDVTGNVTDLTDDMALDVNLKSNLILKDLKKLLPKTMSLGGQGDLKMNLRCKLNELLGAIDKLSFDKLYTNATLTLRNLVFDMDTIHAETPKMNLALTCPASRKVKGRKGAYLELTSGTLDAAVGQAIQAALKDMSLKGNADQFKQGIEQMLAQVDINFSDLQFAYDTIQCHAVAPNISLETSPKKKQGLNVKAGFKSNALNAELGETYKLKTQALAMAASARQDKSKTDFFNQWNPDADFTLTKAEIDIKGVDEKVYIPSIEFDLKESELLFKNGGIRIGRSDLNLKGMVSGIKPWMENHDNLMMAELTVNSNCLDVNEIMELTSGLGVKADSTVVETPEEKEDNPFMVPEGFDFTFNIHSKKAIYGNFEFNEVEGEATIKDGTLMLQEIGFTNEAARMQLTAMYQSPRKNHLFLGMDFHLLDVQINDLLHMIPEIDTIVPMLKTFDGAAEFHIAAQTNLKSNYELKKSTLRASADIEGANLRVKDITSYEKITDMLKVSTNGEYKIDSIDIQLTAFKDEVDLWPFQIAIGKYKATVDGHYNWNTVGEYHISVTDSPLPTRLGLKISGPLNNLSYKLESCKYPHLYRPEKRNDTEQMVMELKKKISDRLKATVRE